MKHFRQITLVTYAALQRERLPGCVKRDIVGVAPLQVDLDVAEPSTKPMETLARLHRQSAAYGRSGDR